MGQLHTPPFHSVGEDLFWAACRRVVVPEFESVGPVGMAPSTMARIIRANPTPSPWALAHHRHVENTPK